MRYNKIKKAQKQKFSCSISPDLIAGNRFEEIINILNVKSELKSQDRYLYGYALLRTQQKLESLITLWPLAAKGHTALQKDCASIAADVFKDEKLLSSVQLSEEALYTLFLAARSLVPQSQAYNTLKQRFFESLWQKGEYEKLERVLKSTKEEFSGIFVENLSKLIFFQPEKKLIGNIPAFVSHILTGGACLIVRNPIYHNDIADEIRSLGNEIKHIFSQVKIKNKQNLTWNESLFESFVEYEVGILIQVLQLAVKNTDLMMDIIPTPSYLMAYDSTARRVSQKFLPWLASENEELFEIYNADTYYAVFWALSGEHLSNNNSILKTVHQSKFHPYLRLALMLRAAANTKKSSLEGIVQIGDIENLKKNESIFKNMAIQTVKAMVNEKSKIQLSPEFWQMLVEFYPVLQDSEIKNILITKSICQLHKEYEDRISLNLSTIKRIAYLTNADKLEKEVEALCARQQVCSHFLLNLRNKKQSEKSIKNIQDEPTLRSHLTLIADSCSLLHSELSAEFFQHIKSLVKNKKINKLILLKNLINYDFSCGCAVCSGRFYRYEIPVISEKLNLPVLRLLDVHSCSDLQPISKTQIPKSSILSQTDPFKILEVSFADSKRIIIEKLMQLIQQSPGQMTVFRQAQSELFNPTQRFLHHYFRYFAHENSYVDTEIQRGVAATNSKKKALGPDSGP